jgi:molecular chaperone GrpE (heat shock protein)
MNSETEPKPNEEIVDSNVPKNISELETLFDETTEKNDSISLEPIQDSLVEIKEILIKRLDLDEFKDKAINRMSEQIEKFEQDILLKIKEGVLKDIITIYDSVDRLSRRSFEQSCISINQELDVLKEEIESILYRNDIELIPLTAENKFDKEIHKAIKREVIYDESSHECVTIIRQGFSYKEKVIRKHEVILKVLETS